MSPHELSYELRYGTGGYLWQRRGIIGLSLGAAVGMGLISLYQTGILKHVPEPRIPGFDADRVNGSDQAYSQLHLPDGLLGMGSYVATAALAAAGGESRLRRHVWLPLALAGKVLLDSAISLKLTRDEVTKHKALCFWCLLATIATLGMLPLVWPEARAAIRRLKRTDAPPGSAMNAVPRHLWTDGTLISRAMTFVKS